MTKNDRTAAVMQRLAPCLMWFVSLPVLPLSQVDAAAEKASAKVSAHAVALRRPSLPARALRPADGRGIAQQRLRDALRRLDAFLAQGDAGNRARWKSYLDWERLSGYGNLSTHPALADLQRAGTPFFAGYRGLELAPFAEVRESLRGYFDAVQAHDDPDFSTKLDQQLTELEEWLHDYATNSDPAVGDKIGPRIAWLERLGVASDLVSQTRAQYVRPNVSVLATGAFIGCGLDADVDDTQPIHDVILGTTIHGWGRTRGRVTTRLEPCDTHAVVRLILTGHTDSSSLGRNGPVLIRSRGTTNLDASKLICVAPTGLTATPASACCTTGTTICSITPQRKLGHRLVERVASHRATSQKSLAESIASRHAEQRVARSMDQRSQTFLTEANAKFEGKFRQALARRRALPQQMRFRSTSDDVRVVALHALADQLAASEPPPVIDTDASVTLQFHESLVSNLGEALLAGVELTDQRIHDLLVENQQPVPEELEIRPDTEPWSITFARQRPVTLRVEGSQIRVGIRGQRFTGGEQKLDRLMEISAVYDMQLGPHGVTLLRTGEVEVDFPDRQGQRLGVAEVTFRTLMRKKFSALFQEQISGKGITPPGRWAQCGTMRLQDVQSHDRWLALGWK